MAGETVQNLVLALREISILIAVLNEAIFDLQLSRGDVFMALAAQPRIALDEHTYPFWVGGMQTTRSVTGFTTHTSLVPGSGDTREVILVATLAITGGMAGATGKREVFLT